MGEQDRRFRNNQSRAARRALAQAALRRRRGPTKRRQSELGAAKDVLRRHGRIVFDAGVDEPAAKGMVRVDGRKMWPADVVAMAREIVARERRRNEELRREKGLA